MLIIPGPGFPAPFFPRILSPCHPSLSHPRCTKPCKNAGKMLFFLSLWAPGCSPKAPKPCKNACFLLLRREKHRKNAGFVLLLGTWGPQKNPTWPLECWLRGPFLILCKTRKHCKNAGIVPFLCLYGLTLTPPDQKGLCKQAFFFSENQKTS